VSEALDEEHLAEDMSLNEFQHQTKKLKAEVEELSSSIECCLYELKRRITIFEHECLQDLQSYVSQLENMTQVLF